MQFIFSNVRDERLEKEYYHETKKYERVEKKNKKKKKKKKKITDEYE